MRLRSSATTSTPSTTIATPSRATPANPARLCALNAGIQLVWGAILAVSLQARSVALAPGEGVRAYAAIAAAGAFIATLVQLAAGASSDRRRGRIGHRREFFAAGIALALPALAWFYLAPDYGQLLLAFFALQFAMNVAGGPYQAVIADYVAAERRGAASSWMAAYQSIGNAAGLLVAGFVHDLRIVTLALALPLAASCGITLAETRRASPESPGNEAPLRLRGPLLTLLLSRGLINVGFFTLLGFLLFFVRDTLEVRGSDAVQMQTALLFLTFTLAAVAGAILAARPTDRYDKRRVVSVAVAVLAVALVVLAAASALPVAYAAAFVAGAAWGAFVAADWALATALLPPGTMATAMGIWNVATTLPQVVAPLATAPLVERANSFVPGLGPRLAIALAILEFLAGAAFVWRLPRV